MNFFFFKKFDKTYLPCDKAWDMCNDCYFNLLKVKKEKALLDDTKAEFEKIFNHHKLSLLGAMITFSEIYYFENIRKLFIEFKSNQSTDITRADSFLIIQIHIGEFKKHYSNIEALEKELLPIHTSTNKMIEEMMYVPNVKNMPKLPNAFMSMFNKK